MEEELDYLKVSSLLKRLNYPSYGSSWCSTQEIKEQLEKMNPDAYVRAFGKCSFRLADDFPRYFVTCIVTNFNEN